MPDRPRAAARHPGRDVAGAAAELDRVERRRGRRASRWTSDSGIAVDAPGLLARLLGPRRSPASRRTRRRTLSHASRLAATCSGSTARETSRGAPHTATPGGGARARAASSIVRSSTGSAVELDMCRRPGHATRRRRGDRARVARAGRSGRRAGRAPRSSVSIVSPTVSSSVAGSRPSASHAARRSAMRVRRALVGQPNQAVFQASAWRAVSRSIRSPLAAMRIGIGREPGAAAAGRRTASSTWCHRPCERHPLAASSGRMISSASSNRPTRWSNG